PRERSVLITDLLTGNRELRADNQPVMRVAEEKFYEPMLPNPTFIICGAGHLGQTIAKLAAWCGFEVTVADDRADLATRERFPDAHAILIEDPVTVVRRFTFDADTYIALVTRGHRHDALILREVIHAPAGYIGMIGSKRKLRMIMDGFIKEGVATAEDFRRVHSPMGVPIGSTSIEEIAVSIVAELIAVRRGERPPT